MKTLGYYNGKYGLLEEMQVPMTDRATFFGDGVYDATYSRNHIIYNLDEHIDRFYNSARLVEIDLPHTKEELKAILREMVQKVDSGEQFVYWQATRGTAIREHCYPDGPANIWIMLKPKPVEDTYKKIKLITLEDTRFLHCNIKTLNLLPSVIASQRTKEANCHEAVFHRGGRVTECAHSNIHILKNGELRTAPTDNLILPGIARRNLINTCAALGVPVREEAFTLGEMMEADEVVISSCGSFCLAAEAIDGKPVGGRAPELLKKLQDALVEDFERVTAGE